MKIELRIEESWMPEFIDRSYDPDDDDIRSILWDVCQAIGQRGDFLVSGFGQDRWPVDVQTDLPGFLEQLPSIIVAIGDAMPAEIEFYEQGVERSINFTPCKDIYMATCTSATMTCWKTDSFVEEIGHEELYKMLSDIKDRFVGFMDCTAPGLIEHPWVKQWLKGVYE